MKEELKDQLIKAQAELIETLDEIQDFQEGHGGSGWSILYKLSNKRDDLRKTIATLTKSDPVICKKCNEYAWDCKCNEKAEPVGSAEKYYRHKLDIPQGEDLNLVAGSLTRKQIVRMIDEYATLRVTEALKSNNEKDEMIRFVEFVWQYTGRNFFQKLNAENVVVEFFASNNQNDK